MVASAKSVFTSPSGYYSPPHRCEAGACEPRIRALITAVENAKDEVLSAVMAEMDAAARRLKITRMDVVGTTTLYRGKLSPDVRKMREVESRELAAIESLYLEVHPGGFMGFWTAKEGWK